jgi:spore germination cell wall hydrolase CwlJ-like protein
MFAKRRITLASGAGVLFALSGIALSASGSSAAELVTPTPLLAYDLSATLPADPQAKPLPAQAQTDNDDSDTADATPDHPVAVAQVDTASVECMAKVVLHEAANQPREGKIAVAQTLVNRLKAGRFGDTICAVANQKGQFFHIASFHPRRDTDGWQEAVELSHEVLAGQADPVAPGAIYFRASYAPTNAFFRTRQRVTTVGAHVFYR